MSDKRKNKDKGGRPRRLDPTTKEQILAVLSDGGSRSLAAAIVGCHHSTISNEAKNDPEFLASLKRAEADCEIHHIRRIREGKPAWQSSAWFLERKWPKRWAKKDPPPPKPMEQEESIRIRAIVRRAAPAPAPAPKPTDADADAG